MTFKKQTQGILNSIFFLLPAPPEAQMEKGKKGERP